MSAAETVLNEVLEAFDFGAPVVGAMRYGCGHINDTFCVHTQPADFPCRCFILQRMSSAAFKRPDQLMSNIIGVTEYLGKKIVAAGGDRSREAMEVIRPRNGEPYYTDSEGGAWRPLRDCQSQRLPELRSERFQQHPSYLPSHRLSGYRPEAVFSAMAATTTGLSA